VGVRKTYWFQHGSGSAAGAAAMSAKSAQKSTIRDLKVSIASTGIADGD
jgi:hypothetical protein